MSTHQSVSYANTAAKLGIPLEIYLAKGASGKRYCSRCKKWLRRTAFLTYENQSTYYSGICKKCKGINNAPKNVVKGSWGPSLAGANRIGAPVKEYLVKRAAGFRWCTDHKGWFDANHIINAPDYQEKPISRCALCNRKRISDYRVTKKRRREQHESLANATPE